VGCLVSLWGLYRMFVVAKETGIFHAAVEILWDVWCSCEECVGCRI
jgi:hypothetical protein